MRPSLNRKSLCDAYIFGFTPIGIFGAHHFYLNRIGWGFMYLFTFGLLGCGYLYDLFRLPVLVKRRNLLETCENPSYEKQKAHVDDIYILWFPFGLFGFHHYYLNRLCFGFMYTFTFGLLGIGWIIDFFRLPCLVKTYNQNLKATQALNANTVLSPNVGYGQQVVFAKPDDFSLVGSAPPPQQATNDPRAMHPQAMYPPQQQQFPAQQQQYVGQNPGVTDPYAAGPYGYNDPVQGMIAPPSYDATVAGTSRNQDASKLPMKSDGYGSTDPK